MEAARGGGDFSLALQAREEYERVQSQEEKLKNMEGEWRNALSTTGACKEGAGNAKLSVAQMKREIEQQCGSSVAARFAANYVVPLQKQLSILPSVSPPSSSHEDGVAPPVMGGRADRSVNSNATAWKAVLQRLNGTQAVEERLKSASNIVSRVCCNLHTYYSSFVTVEDIFANLLSTAGCSSAYVDAEVRADARRAAHRPMEVGRRYMLQYFHDLPV